MLGVWGVYFILFEIVIVSGNSFHIGPDKFTRDLNSVVHVPFYIGAISNFGIILWAASAVICFFTYAALKRYKPTSVFKPFMLHAGIITTILMFDDLYMLHEQVFPEYLNIPEHFVYLFYAAYLTFFLVRFKNILLRTEYVILMIAFLFLGISVLMDEAIDLNFLLRQGSFIYKHETLIEDFFKSFGILTWLIYFSRTSFSTVLPNMLGVTSGKHLIDIRDNLKTGLSSLKKKQVNISKYSKLKKP